MSPETFRIKLTHLYSEMLELYEAGNDSPTLSSALFRLHKAASIISPVSIGKTSAIRFVTGKRHYFDRMVELFVQQGTPLSLPHTLKLLKKQHRDLADVDYRSFYAVVRGEVRKGLKRRIAECGFRRDKKLYGLPFWDEAKPYVPGVKNSTPWVSHAPLKKAA